MWLRRPLFEALGGGRASPVTTLLRRRASTSTQVAVPWTRRPRVIVLGLAGIAGGVWLWKEGEGIRRVASIGVVRFARVGVAAAHIFTDYKLSLRNLPYPSDEYSKTIKEVHKRSAERLLRLACANGGVFIKHIATLEYLLPREYTKTLSILHSKAPQQSFEEVKFVVEKELGTKLEIVFSEFSDEPVGAASLAQVHLARLRQTGEQVAVKVQHRRVKSNSLIDIATMELFVNIAAWLFPDFHLLWLVDETKRNLPYELDFIHEGQNADAVRNAYSHLKFLKA